jgi:UDPglucose 6-dehydrogenase
MTTVGFAGMTHLGLVSASAVASRGFDTVCFDPDLALIGLLKSGDLPVVEPGLDDLVQANGARQRFTCEPADLAQCDVVYISPDVPTDDNGISDLGPVTALIGEIEAHLKTGPTLVVLSQVPPGFTRTQRGIPHDQLVYQVETLVFGQAVERALHPERIIVGVADPECELPAAYAELLTAFGCPILKMGYESAELAKISINCCLVASVSVANTLAELSEAIGADWSEIAPALKLDRRIGAHAYLSPGLGISGGNLERDLRTVATLGERNGTDVGVVKAWLANSAHRKNWMWRTLRDNVLADNPRAAIAMLGLAYKENTHSTKNSPALHLLAQLGHRKVRVHDPVVPAAAAPTAQHCASAIDCARGADVLVLATPWPEYRKLSLGDLARGMRGRVLIDPYRLIDGTQAHARGFAYHTLGRPPLEQAREPERRHG